MANPAPCEPPVDGRDAGPARASAPQRPPPRSLTLLLHAGFFLTGTTAVLLGPLIPELRGSWGVDTSRAASLFIVQFMVSSAGSVVAGFHLRRSLLAGYGSMALGLLLLTPGDWLLARPAIACLGLGIGLTIPASNLAVARLNPLRRGASLATLNLLWGVGAMACPLLFAVLRGRAAPAVGLWILAVPVVAVTAALAGRPWSGGAARQTARGETQTDTGAPSGGRLLPLALLAGLLFLDVGVENALGGWLVELADRLGGERTAVSMIIGSGFWGAVLAGRAVAPACLGRLREMTLYRAALLLALAGVGALLIASTRPALATGALIAGFALAPVFPLTVALLAEQTAATGSGRSGWVFAFGGLGGACLPWATGRLTAGVPAVDGWLAGLANPGIVVPLTGVVGMAVLLALYGRSSAGPPPSAPSSSNISRG